MKSKRLPLLLTVILVVMLLSSCCKKVPDYTRLIPSEAGVVMRVDVRQIAAKMSFASGGKLNGRLKQMMKERLSDATRQKLETIMNDPAQMGLDLRDPVLVYYYKASEEIGLLGTMYKADRFADLLNVLAKETGMLKVSTVGGVKYADIANVLVVFNDDWFFVTRRNGKLSAKAQALLIDKRSQTADNPWADNEAFKRMCGKKGIAQAYVEGQQLYDMAYAYDSPVNITKLIAVVDLAVERAEARATLELVAKNDAGKKELDRYDALMGGQHHGLNIRLSAGIIDRLLQQNSDYDDMVARFVARLVKYIELKYEGDARLVCRWVTNDISKTPIESVFALLKDEFGL